MNRVVVVFDPSPRGLDTLEHAVSQARARHAPLYVVHRRPARRPLPRGPVTPLVSAEPWQDHDLHVATFDALLLAVGAVPADLDVRVAVVEGGPRSLAALVDPDDLVLEAPSWSARLAARVAHRPMAR